MTEYDIVFCDTCIGGSTVATRLAKISVGIRAFYLADYEVNPLGMKPPDEVGEALLRWIQVAAPRSRLLVVACNTASVFLQNCPEVLHRADDLGLSVFSMVDLLEEVLTRERDDLEGKRVCLMGTRFTVEQSVYRDRLAGTGAREVIPLAATRTERAVAHLEHRSRIGRETIESEIDDAVREAEVVVLGCTCFPLVAEQFRELNPHCVLVDPAAGVSSLPAMKAGVGPNRLTLVSTGSVPSQGELREQAPVLFPGWKLEAVEADFAAGP